MSTNAPVEPPDHPEYADLVDDCSLMELPSGAGVPSLAAAVARHREAAGATSRLRSLVVPDPVLPALLDLPGLVGDEDPLAVTVAVSGGAGGIEPAARWAQRPPLAVAGLATTLRDLDDLAGAARRTVAAAQQVADTLPGLAEVPVSVGLPLDGVGQAGWEGALDELAMADHVVSFRTGDHAVPAPVVVAAMDAALDREVAMRFSGAHPEVSRGGRPGYRNLLLAVRLTLDGEPDEAQAVLAEDDPARLDARAADLGPDALLRARRWLRSVEARPA